MLGFAGNRGSLDMRPEDVHEHVAAQPFKPFRIFMSDGTTFDIRHPELCLIGCSSLHVAIPDRKRSWMADRVSHCALIHVTRIEPINGRNDRAPKPKRRPSR